MAHLISGEAAFDEQVRCEARNAEDGRRLLAKEPVREALCRLVTMNAIVQDNIVLRHTIGFDNSVPKLSERLTQLRQLAAALDPADSVAYARSSTAPCLLVGGEPAP